MNSKIMKIYYNINRVLFIYTTNHLGRYVIKLITCKFIAYEKYNFHYKKY